MQQVQFIRNKSRSEPFANAKVEQISEQSIFIWSVTTYLVLQQFEAHSCKCYASAQLLRQSTYCKMIKWINIRLYV